MSGTRLPSSECMIILGQRSNFPYAGPYLIHHVPCLSIVEGPGRGTENHRKSQLFGLTLVDLSPFQLNFNPFLSKFCKCQIPRGYSLTWLYSFMCGPSGYCFTYTFVLMINRVSFSAILAINRACFLHSCLVLNLFFCL